MDGLEILLNLNTLLTTNVEPYNETNNVAHIFGRLLAIGNVKRVII